MKICRTCLEPYGYFFEDGRRYKQKCSCTWSYRDRLWPRHDFNQTIELCYCCGREVIPSGSKFSAFFCEPCRKRVRGFNKRLGTYLIPLGRHSIMGCGYVKGTASEEEIAQFVNKVRSMADSNRTVRTWRHKIASENLQQALGNCEEDPELDAYLAPLDKRHSVKKKAFERLCRFIAGEED